MADSPEKTDERRSRESSSDSEMSENEKQQIQDRKETKEFRDALVSVLQDQQVAFDRMAKGMEDMATSYKAMSESMKNMSTELKTCLAEVRTLGLEKQEVPSPLSNSTTTPGQSQNTNTQTLYDTQNSESEPLSLINATFENINKQLTLQNEITSKLQNKITSTKVHVNRDYKLNAKGNIDLWLDLLDSELAENDLLAILKDPQKFENDQTENTLKKKRSVRTIIISHLDANYHKKILQITEPHKIIEKIKEIRKIEANLSEINIRQKLYAIRKGHKERVGDFCDRFDSIVREHETCNPESPLSEEEKRATFYQAVRDTSKELVSTHLVRSQTGTIMTLDDMKKCMLQIEAQSTTNTEKPKASVAQRTEVKDQSNSEKTVYKDVKCYRCNEKGHYQSSCRLARDDLWFCYKCNKVREHKGDECPNKVQRIP